MKKSIISIILIIMFNEYAMGVQSFFSITLVKMVENNDGSKNRIIWLNYPINPEYRFVEDSKIRKSIFKRMDVTLIKDQYLKLSEWNLECIGDKESIIQCILWDQAFYLITIKLNFISGNKIFCLKVEKVEEEKKMDEVRISWLQKGQLITDSKYTMEKFLLLSFELTKNKRYYLAVERINDIPKEKIFKGIEFKKYIVYLKNFEFKIMKKSGKKPRRIIVNIRTGVYGRTDLLEFLSGKKSYIKLIREKVSRWLFDCPKLPTLQFYRTNFFILPESESRKGVRPGSSGGSLF